MKTIIMSKIFNKIKNNKYNKMKMIIILKIILKTTFQVHQKSKKLQKFRKRKNQSISKINQLKQQINF